MSLYLRTGRPLVSLESRRPLPAFDLIAFSLSFENDYPNILKILDMGRVPLLAVERRKDAPLVMAGGVTTFMNPEPLAPFIDMFLLGEAEICLDGFLDALLAFGAEAADRDGLIRRLARNLPWLYAPSLYLPRYGADGILESFRPTAKGIPDKIRVAVSSPDEFARAPVVRSTLTTPQSDFGDKVLVELGRGCGRSCRFCAAGYVYRPPRVRDESRLRSCLEDALATCGQVGLVSAAVTDVPGLERITSAIAQGGWRFSVSSLRADGLTEGLLADLKQVGQKTVAIAPEAGSERLRRVINKHLSQDQVTQAAARIARAGDFSLRLYFLIGLPTETRTDMAAIVDLVKVVKHRMLKEGIPRGRIGQIRLSVTCFVPKPFTPFQWFPLENVTSLKEKQAWLRGALSKVGGVKIGFDLPKWAYIQSLFSMGDRRVGRILLNTHRLNGNWKKAFASSEVNPDFFVYRLKGIDETLPWDFIDNGLSKAWLAGEYALGLKEKESDVCRVGECTRCGVCRAVSPGYPSLSS